MKSILYFKIAGSIILYIAVIGFILPYLFSAKSDILPIAGVGVVVAILYLFIIQIINVFKFLKKL
jgi:hypothetical protein